MQNINELKPHENNYFDGFQVVEFLKHKYTPQKDVGKESSIKSTIVRIKSKISQQWETKVKIGQYPFKFLKNTTLKINSEVVNSYQFNRI